MAPKWRVVVVDDHAPFLQGLVQVLDATPEFVVVGQEATAEGAITLAEALAPDVILLDVQMPGGGLTAARQIARTCRQTRIVMLTSSGDEEDMRAAAAAGVAGYVLKGVAARELVDVLRAVCAGERPHSPTLL